MWSNYQQAIFGFVTEGTGNAIIQAVAGSGKTTTIVEAMRLISGGPSSIFLAFNKAIATELSKRGVNAKTFHSLTYSAVTKFKKARTVDADKTWKLLRQNCGEKTQFDYGAFAAKLVGLAKQSGIDCLVPDTEEEWNKIVEHHELELDSEEEGISVATGIELARDLLKWSNESDMVDFDDLLYVAVKEGLALPRFNWIFVDEAQDTNAIQRAILRKIMMPQSRLIAVGDKAQAIYGFRGADSQSLQLIADEFNAIELPLAVSYRCATNVVDYARRWVPHIEAADGAPVGEVVNLGEKWDVTNFAPNDLVVCRTTKPLIALAYKMLRARVAVRIMGREIGADLIRLIEKMNAKGIDAMLMKLEAWRVRETEKAKAKNQDGKVESINDKVDAINVLTDSLAETERTIPALIAIINDLFADKYNAVILATIHKAKGLEADRVFWLNRSQCPSRWARQPWQVEQENNLCYVAATRAKMSLLLIEEPLRE